jgi:hypothetical protein
MNQQCSGRYLILLQSWVFFVKTTGIRVFFEGKKIIIREHHQFCVIFKDQIQRIVGSSIPKTSKNHQLS